MNVSENGKEEQVLPPVQDYILLADHMLAHEYPSQDILNKEPGWRRYGNLEFCNSVGVNWHR